MIKKLYDFSPELVYAIAMCIVAVGTLFIIG